MTQETLAHMTVAEGLKLMAATLSIRMHALASLARDCAADMGSGKRKLAIGTLAEIERCLPEIEALTKTIIVVHRNTKE